MERGRALRWVAGDEASIASRRTPSVRFAIAEPSQQAHDSLVSVFQCRRTRRGPRPGWRAPRRREPTLAPGPAGDHYQAVQPRGLGSGGRGLLRRFPSRRAPRNDGSISRRSAFRAAPGRRTAGRWESGRARPTRSRVPRCGRTESTMGRLRVLRTPRSSGRA